MSSGRVPKFTATASDDSDQGDQAAYLVHSAPNSQVDSDDVFSSGDDTSEKPVYLLRLCCLASGILVVSLGVYFYWARQSDHDVKLGPWTLVDSSDDEAGIRIRVVGDRQEPSPTSTPPMQAIAPAIPPMNVTATKVSPMQKLTVPPPPRRDFCNLSMPVIKDWGVRGPFNLSFRWNQKCHDSETRPPMTWNWPGRNWCWVRTKTKSCYPAEGEKYVPNWYWAQHRVFEEGFAPNPDEELLKAYVNPQLCDLGQLGNIWTDVTAEQRETAAAWVNENIAIYVVNLPTSVKRWQAMKDRLNQLGLKGDRIPGVDLRKPGALERAQAEGIVPKEYRYDIALDNMHELMAESEKHGILKLVDEMGIGTVGCAAAHLRAQRLAHSLTVNAKKKMALIMEDDVWLADDVAVKLKHIVDSELPCNWEVYALTTRCGYGECVAPHVSRVQPDGNEPNERCHNSGNYGMYGMLYRVESMMKINEMLQAVCFNDQKPACLPVDIALASLSDRVGYYATPGSQSPGLAWEAKNLGGSDRYDANEEAVTGKDKDQLEDALKKKKGAGLVTTTTSTTFTTATLGP